MWRIKESIRLYWKENVVYFIDEINQNEDYIVVNNKKDIEVLIERKDFDEKFVLFEKLKEKNMIKKNQLNNFKNTKYEKSIEFISEISNNSNEVQNKIEQSKVMIIGAGGMGNSILRQLIFLGVKNFTLIDFDNVEVTNLNRQEFYRVN